MANSFSLKKRIKKLLGIPPAGELSVENFIHYKRVKYGPLFYKDKYTAKEVVNAMQRIGLKKGSVLMVHSSWDEFYNCTSSPNELIDEILRVIGTEGTLCMPAFPLIRKNKVFNIKKTVTKAGILAEAFRTYPGVKRSVNVRHSVCALGPLSEYLLSEHHLGATCWDEKSPFYKLTLVGGQVYALGLGKYWEGTCIHCVEAMLRGQIPYYTDMFFSNKTEYQYIDENGDLKSYWNYDMPTTGKNRRMISYFKNRHYIRKYLHPEYVNVSNLQIAKFDANHIVTTLTELAMKGKDIYILPLKYGYKFN